VEQTTVTHMLHHPPLSEATVAWLAGDSDGPGRSPGGAGAEQHPGAGVDALTVARGERVRLTTPTVDDPWRTLRRAHAVELLWPRCLRCGAAVMHSDTDRYGVPQYACISCGRDGLRFWLYRPPTAEALATAHQRIPFLRDTALLRLLDGETWLSFWRGVRLAADATPEAAQERLKVRWGEVRG
jgi:hypothetical protein